MTHLGDLASALVDGELTGAELDRANAHLAACPACRAEAAQLRRLKSELSALTQVDGADALTRRLLAMPSPAGHDLGRAGQDLGRVSHGFNAGRPGLRAASLGAANYEPGPWDPLASRPLRRGPGGPGTRRRGRYAVWGAVSLVVAGVGAAAFGMGGGSGTTERPVTPQLEMLDLQHAATSGDVPFTDPPKLPVRAAARPAAKAAARP